MPVPPPIPHTPSPSFVFPSRLVQIPHPGCLLELEPQSY